MTESIPALALASHYYKLGHIGTVNCTVYVSETSQNTSLPSSDQSLLELELSIRHQHPRLIITYYNKCLYHFTLDHWNDPIDLSEYSLVVKHTMKVGPETLAHPVKSTPASDTSSPDSEFLPFLNVSFTKALKKLVLYNLSRDGMVQLFGNYAVYHDAVTENVVVYLDPILLPNGDILVSVCVQQSPALHSSSCLTINENTDANFVIYLIPSGIRCHLYDAVNPVNSFTYTPPKNCDNLLQLLKLSTGIDYSVQKKDILWVKLIPNLQHLNNQTSTIAKFIHLVDNKKFIVWPWNLCFLQFGLVEKNSFQELSQKDDPLSLIADLMNFNISKNHLRPPAAVNSTAFSIPSAQSTGIASTEPAVDSTTMDMGDITNGVSDFFGLSETAEFFNETAHPVSEMDIQDSVQFKRTPKDELDELDDLFGDDSDEQNENEQEQNENQQNEQEQNEQNEEQTFEKDENIEKSESLVKPDSTPRVAPYIDIPKDQMTIPALRSFKNQTPQVYDDPGAPLPMIPTPMLNRASSVNSQTTDDSESKSIFSPIIFNPIIKSNIDTKYGKGGKFYVDKESSVGPEHDVKKRKLRATSVSGYERPFKKEDRLERGLGIGFLDEHAIDDEIDHSVDAVEQSEEEDVEEEESDEDEDVEQDSPAKESPLKLNFNTDIPPASAPEPKQLGQFGNVVAYLSPLSNSVLLAKNPSLRFDSPMGSGNYLVDSLGASNSPSSLLQASASIDFQPSHETLLTQESDQAKKDLTPESSGSSPNKQTTVTESSNCLPLILRGVNVGSIPNVYFLNNIKGLMSIPAVPSDFNMDVDDDENDFEFSKNNELMVRVDNLNEFLGWLGQNLIYDFGLCKRDLTKPYAPGSEVNDIPRTTLVEGELPPSDFERRFHHVFPLCYRVSLNEFINETNPQHFEEDTSTSQDELTNQLSFLDDIANDDLLNPKSQLKKLHQILWDSINYEDSDNRSNFDKYVAIIDNFNRSNAYKKVDEDHVFSMADNKVKVLKQKSDIINLNSTGLKFWSYLNFCPISGPKKFQVLMISKNAPSRVGDNVNHTFLNSLIYNYNEGNFGNIGKLNLPATEQRPNGVSVSDGLLLFDLNGLSYNEVYKSINRKLTGLVESIRLDLMNKTNSFEFNRPLLLLFVNFDDSVNAVLQILKICRNFKMCLIHHQLPLVDVFTHVVPAQFIFKQRGTQQTVRYLLNHKLCKLSMVLYNKCPNPTPKTGNFLANNPARTMTRSLYTNLVRAPPSKLHFKFLNNGKDASSSAYSDELFLHLAYERTIDRTWICAAWLDPLGITTYTKLWYCGPAGRARAPKDVYDVGAVADEMWDISCELFKQLNNDVIKRTSGLGGKKFLVLTRVNNVIPDDELVHWKRLNVKHKEVSLIVLSVSRKPRILFRSQLSEEDPQPKLDASSVGATVNSYSMASNHRNLMSTTGSMGGLPLLQHLSITNTLGPSGVSATFPFPPSSNLSPTTAGATLVPSPSINGGINLHSPQQFLNAPGNFLLPHFGTGANPQNSTNPDMILHDKSMDITAIIPRVPLPSFTSPSRLGMKIGYLVKQSAQSNHMLVYEATLLSCSNFWKLDAIMKIVLEQYKKLTILNEVLGLNEVHPGDDVDHSADMLVPWHINAVGRLLDYLVHVSVEE